MKKKILEVNIDDVNCGGVFILVKNIIENKPINMQIDIASIEGFKKDINKKIFQKEGCKVFYIGSKKNKFLKQWNVYKNLRKLLHINKYDCVHIHGDTSNKLLVSSLAALKEKIPIVIVHSHACGVEGNHMTLKKKIHAICKLLLKNINVKRVACSITAAKWMYGMDSDVEIINNGICADKFKFDSNKRFEQRNKLGISNEILIGNVGRYCFPKNHLYMLKIAKELNSRHVNFKMIFIGTGELEENIKKTAKKLKINNRIIFYGLTDRVQDLLQAIDVFIMPSIYEGFPIAGIEAQASGLPVIYSNSLTKEVKIQPEVRFLEISDNNINNWCNKILEFSKTERKDMTNNIKKAGFGIETTISSLIKLYK